MVEFHLLGRGNEGVPAHFARAQFLEQQTESIAQVEFGSLVRKFRGRCVPMMVVLKALAEHQPGSLFQRYLRANTEKAVAQNINAVTKRAVGDADGTLLGVVRRSRQTCASQSMPCVQSRSL